MTVFISRSLSAQSPLAAWAEAGGHNLLAHSLIDFRPVPFSPPGQADWWFFYSSRAVEFALLQGIPAVKLAAMGPGTAKTLQKLAGRVDFVGAGKPEEVAEAFGERARGQQVFFPRARQSRKTVQTLLDDQIRVLDDICYNNIAVPQQTPILAEVYIFTSPLNVSAYVDHQALTAGAGVIAIGPSTAAALTVRGVNCLVAASPDEEAVVSVLRALP
ncbi:uroporphyrinogen-III synthase [Neolewinella agarilytica]|uniref:Uroporphyrinogen-III synthase n=1 Tax=Neolewinella agarilytica TaxID=478744 RepID=A0A1H9KBL8_9BACT|nr:uroporphyrinogen-III synthase [Neolewinella agarilytica]SEQ96458.1 uroporphyrinogen-III synthase [Neolewinella agarilytica]